MKSFFKRILPLSDFDTNKLRYGKYYIENNEIYTASVEDLKAELKYLCNDFTITKIIYNKDTQTFKYEILLQTTNGEKKVTVDKSVFTSRNLEGLTAKGFSFEPDGTKEVLKYALLQEDDAEKITEYSYLGFKDNHFFGFHRNDDRCCVNRIKLEESDCFEKSELNILLDNAPMLQLAFTIAASSAVQSFLGKKLPLSTMLYHFYGDSSQGKTTALLTTSVWGKPTVESGLFSTWNQTELSLMNLLANNFGVTVALDESSICRFDLTSTIYNISQGINRQRLQKNLQQQPTKEWLTTILSSGESSLLEHTNKNNGLRARTIEFNQPVTLSAEHSNKCKEFFLHNFGHTGREIVEALAHSTLERMIRHFNKERTTFLTAVKKNEKSPLTERLADSFAVLLLTAKILKILKYTIDTEAILQILLNKNREIGEGYDIGEKLHTCICDRVASKRNLYPNIGEYYGGAIEGLVAKNGEVSILESAFDKIIKDNNFSSKLVCLRALDRIGAIRKQRKDTFYSKKIIERVPTKVLVIKLYNKNLKGDHDYEVHENQKNN